VFGVRNVWSRIGAVLCIKRTQAGPSEGEAEE